MSGAKTFSRGDLRGTWKDTAVALGLVALGLVIRMAMTPLIGTDFPFVTFFLGTVYAAWRCRWQASVMIMILGWIAAHWFFIPPIHTLALSSPSTWFGTLGFFASCIAVITLGERLRRQNLRLREELDERRRAEDQLRQSAQFPEQNPSPVMRASANGELLYCNPAGRKLIEEWKIGVGQTIGEPFRSWVAEVLSQKKLSQQEQQIGDKVYHFVAAPFPDLGYVNLYGRDITKKRAMERVTERALEKFHLLSDVSSRLLASEDPQRIINELCTRVMQHLGCDNFLNYLFVPERHAMRLNASAGISPEDVRKIEWLNIGQSLCGRSAQQQCPVIEYNIQESDDPQAATLLSFGFKSYACHPLMAAGRILGTLSFASKTRDRFTEEELNLMARIADQVAIALDRIRSAEALRNSEFRFRAMADASPAMIWITDPEMRFSWFNKAWHSFVGTRGDEDLREGWIDRVHPDDAERCRSIFARTFEKREPYEMEYRVRRHDGEYRWILDCGTPMTDPSGDFKGFIGSCIDVHERHVQRDELERAVRERTGQLQDSVAELESFSYSIAHDMRAPLRAMHGFGKILMQESAGHLDEDGKEYLRRIIVSAQRLDALIQDVLSYSRIARSELPLETVELDSFIRDILVSYPDFSGGKARIEVKDKLPSVLANGAALTQVVSNLLGNAVKFVPKDVFPQIEIGAETEGSIVRLSFRDNGIGIDHESQARIFQMFQRLNRADLYEGTGIGLAIVRKAVERMGGSVYVESEPGKGSIFYVELKAAVK